MSDANEDYFHASLRHAIEVRRYQMGTVKQMLAILELADKDLAEQIRQILIKLDAPIARAGYNAQRLKVLLDDLRAARVEVFRRIQEELQGQLIDFAHLEANVEQDIIESSVPLVLSLAKVNLRTVGALIENSPFQGALLKDWFNTLEAADQARIQQALTIGMTNGESIDQIVRRVVGTRANNYQDGALSVSRRNAEAIVRTAVNHVSNAARQTVWADNSDIIDGERWVATLDGRTSAICRARDGMVFPVGEGPRPPAHWNCRSVMVAVLSGVGIVGNRPYVVDTRTRGARETDFKAEAKQRGVSIQQVREEWAAKNIGQTPAATTYQEWLTKQPAAFQDSVLGEAKGKLFRDGNLELSKFVDRLGNELNLKQLKEMYPAAWSRAFSQRGS